MSVVDLFFGDGDSTPRQRMIRRRIIVLAWTVLWVLVAWRQQR